MPRKFDWDAAIKMRRSGYSLQSIADRFGVTRTAVWYVVEEAGRKRNDAAVA